MSARRRPLRQIPDEIRTELHKLLSDEKMTISQITDRLRARGADVSRSAVGRYAQTHERMAADIRAARTMAEAIGQELSDVSGDAGRLVIESLQALLLRARMQISEEDEIEVGELGKLTRAAKDLQQALKANVDASIRVREQALQDAAATVEKTAAEAGISSDTVEFIKARILGVRSGS